MFIQSVLFDKNKYTEKEARDWLKKNNYYSNGKIHVTDTRLRFRQLNPDKFNFFRTIKLNQDIDLIIGY